MVFYNKPKFNIAFLGEHPREFEFFLGDKLGSGCYRDVFDFIFNNEYVVKIAISTEGRQANLLEYKMWDTIQGSGYEKYFADINGVSASGEFLLMRKVEKRHHALYPKKVPHFFSDLKWDNYGWIDNKFVCCDYGTLMINLGMTDRMKKADWWSPEDE